MRPMVVEVGQVLPVELPNEIIRGQVVEVRSQDEIVVGLTVQPPMTKNHTYIFGQEVACRRGMGMGGAVKWEPIV